MMQFTIGLVVGLAVGTPMLVLGYLALRAIWVGYRSPALVPQRRTPRHGTDC